MADDKVLTAVIDGLDQLSTKLDEVIANLVKIDSFLETTKEAWEQQKSAESDQVLEGDAGAES